MHQRRSSDLKCLAELGIAMSGVVGTAPMNDRPRKAPTHLSLPTSRPLQRWEGLADGLGTPLNGALLPATPEVTTYLVFNNFNMMHSQTSKTRG